MHAAVADELALAHGSSQNGADGLGGDGSGGDGGDDAAAVPRRAGAFSDADTTSSSGAAGKTVGALVAAAVGTRKKDPAEDPSLTDEERFLKSTDALPKSIYGGGTLEFYFLTFFSLRRPLLVTLFNHDDDCDERPVPHLRSPESAHQRSGVPSQSSPGALRAAPQGVFVSKFPHRRRVRPPHHPGKGGDEDEEQGNDMRPMLSFNSAVFSVTANETTSIGVNTPILSPRLKHISERVSPTAGAMYRPSWRRARWWEPEDP